MSLLDRPRKLGLVSSLTLVAVSVTLSFLLAVAQAQPKLEMHRAGVNADDGSGWHLGVSTKGSFSIRLPIPFNDFTTHDPKTGEATHVIGAKSAEGIKFSAVELAINAKSPGDLDAILKTFAANSANKVSNVERKNRDGLDTLDFSVANATSMAHLRYIKARSVLYALTIECPNAQRELVAAIKGKFFDSFKPKTSS